MLNPDGLVERPDGFRRVAKLMRVNLAPAEGPDLVRCDHRAERNPGQQVSVTCDRENRADEAGQVKALTPVILRRSKFFSREILSF